MRRHAPEQASTRPRRRDRRGRGLRGPLAPAQVPITRTRAERFDDLVLDAVERLEKRWGTHLVSVEFAVEEVPPVDGDASPGRRVPLARLSPAAGAVPARIVVYRRPLEARAADRSELGTLVHDVVVEEVAELLGLEPEHVDPRYDGHEGHEEE
ncbi:MAG: metallopeptidase family protein [Carbonactinosporaceae bacterium]